MKRNTCLLCSRRRPMKRLSPIRSRQNWHGWDGCEWSCRDLGSCHEAVRRWWVATQRKFVGGLRGVPGFRWRRAE